MKKWIVNVLFVLPSIVSAQATKKDSQPDSTITAKAEYKLDYGTNPATNAKPKQTGSLSKKVVWEIVTSANGRVQACYEKQLDKNLTLKGKITQSLLGCLRRRRC